MGGSAPDTSPMPCLTEKCTQVMRVPTDNRRHEPPTQHLLPVSSTKLTRGYPTASRRGKGDSPVSRHSATAWLGAVGLRDPRGDPVRRWRGSPTDRPAGPGWRRPCPSAWLVWVCPFGRPAAWLEATLSAGRWESKQGAVPAGQMSEKVEDRGQENKKKNKKRRGKKSKAPRPSPEHAREGDPVHHGAHSLAGWHSRPSRPSVHHQRVSPGCSRTVTDSPLRRRTAGGWLNLG